MNAGGLVTGVSPGTATIAATIDGKSGVSQVSVLAVPVIVSVSVSPTISSLTTGQTAQLTATAFEATGTVVPGKAPAWASSNASVASVSASGLVTAGAVGTASISATVEGRVGNATINVSAPPPVVASVGVSPSSGSVTVGGTAAFTATARDAAGNTISGKSFAWTSSNPPIAFVDASGVVTGQAVGSVSISATVDGKVGTSLLAVTAAPPIVSTVTITPSTSTLIVGASSQLSAVARDASGAIVPGKTVAWTSSNRSVADVAANGFVSAVSAGTAIIAATVDGRTGTATIVVEPPAPVVTTVSVTPAAAAVPMGGLTQFAAIVRDQYGSTITGKSLIWSSSNPAVADARSNGVVAGVAAGRATITASVDGRSGAATVDVTPPPTDPVASVTITPSSASLSLGGSTTLTAVVRGASGLVLSGRPVSWSSSNSSVVSVSQSGVVTGIAAGNATVTATSEGKSGSASVTVSGGYVRLLITNQLVKDVNVYVNSNQNPNGSVPAGQTRQVMVDAGANIVLRGKIVQQYGDQISGTFPSQVANRDLTYTINNQFADGSAIFAPIIENVGSQTLLIGVNMGLRSENRCNCTVAPGQRAVVGYFRYYSNSNVRAYLASNGYAGQYYFWSPTVAVGSGVVTLRAP